MVLVGLLVRKDSAVRHGILLLLGLMLLSGIVFAGAPVALAGSNRPPFGPPFESGQGYTDDRNFSFTSIESNEGDYYLFLGHMHASMYDDYGAQTVISAHDYYRTYYTWIDIEWFLTAQSNLDDETVAADITCARWSNQTAYKCDQFRMRVSERNRTASNATLDNIACHEIAHGVGFDHGDTGQSCIDEGNNGIITWYEIGKINGHY